MSLKIMLLTDSNGHPRAFPPSEIFYPEDTYPFLLRDHFKDVIFWQLTYGDITTSQLVSQPLAYIPHWKPDMIIVQSGINDCSSEAFSPTSFRTTIKKLKLIYPETKILWVEIGSGDKYEETCPGVTSRIAQYNEIIQQLLGQDFVSIKEKMIELNGFNAVDHVHMNKRAHKALAEILIKKINVYLAVIPTKAGIH